MSSSFQYCSLLSIQARLDPNWVGLNHDFDYYLIFEIPKPWARKVEFGANFPKELTELFEKIKQDGIKFKFLGLEKNKEYTPAGKIKLLFYKNSNEYFVEFSTIELNVPENKLITTIRNLFEQNSAKYSPYLIESETTQDIFVCNHSARDRCCGTFGKEIYHHLTNTSSNYRVWKSSHMGGHRLAP
ncbi:MAG: hypothetical protein IH840_12610, partial [Candidatus Heimdallarchaeota archaeon]|nr:hypothetical protein [Candidatus Heimdallarchaeota archaeon]